MSELADRVAIVTGASSGIGRATALRFAEAGARVAIFARRKERLDEIAATTPDRLHAVAGDIANPEDIERLFVETERRFGDCEILVNNAGMVDPKNLVDMTTEEWDRVFDVNVRSAFLASRRAIVKMLTKRRGSIVNLASISGIPGPEKFPGSVAYCAAKGAVILFTETLAAELRDSGIRVNCISPGSVDTPMLYQAAPDAVPSMSPEEIAEVILFVASDRSRPMNGQNVHVYSA